MVRRTRQDLQFTTGTYEAWLRSQPHEEGRKGHKSPEPDLYEEWLKERVLKKGERIEHEKRKHLEPSQAI